MRTVKVSAKSARLLFHDCTPDYITSVCHGRCCYSSTAPQGTMITIHLSEQAAIEARGASVVDHMLQTPGKRCPFKTPDELCGLHGTPDKPFGCIASPFTLNSNGTMIVRNRYKALKCYRDGGEKHPAYRVFRASLDRILDADEEARLVAHLDAGGGDLSVSLGDDVYAMLRENDDAKRKKPHLAQGGAPMPLDRAKARKASARGLAPGGQGSAASVYNNDWKGYKGARPSHGPTDRRAADGTLDYSPSRETRTVYENSGCGFARGEAALGTASDGTSVFDATLCEMAYRWFSPPGGVVLDPFAGGSVRGIIAAKLGLQYVGVDLSERQIAANCEQAERICDEVQPCWHVGDSRELATIAAGVEADFVFSCPPYADLEVYSDDPRDISGLDYPDFLVAYREIIRAAIGLLKQDRFACFVVGKARGSDGYYYGLVPDTVRAFEDAGARYYNEAIYVGAIGSLPVRVARQFEGGRKLGKTHQNVLVFCKGDWKKATEACGPIDVFEHEPCDDGCDAGI